MYTRLFQKQNSLLYLMYHKNPRYKLASSKVDNKREPRLGGAGISLCA